MLEKYQTFLLSYNINLSFLYCSNVTSFHQKLKIRTTKVSREDIYLVDMG
jgi:hypothetical protein